MKFRKIKLSPKKGGNGFISSYSVNIGSDEAKECGFILESKKYPYIVKCIDLENEQIIIRKKKLSVDTTTINTVMHLALEFNRLDEDMMLDVPSEEGLINLADIPDVSPTSTNSKVRAVHEAENLLRDYLWSLPDEAVIDITILMWMGRNHDYNKSLKGEQRFIEYWASVCDSPVFDDRKAGVIEYLIEKSPLAEYIKGGLNAIDKK